MLNQGALLQNRYRVLRQIGGGGMGITYLAEDTRLAGRRCAIKEMSPAQLSPQDRAWAIPAFQQEAQMLANLKHHGLTPVTDFFPEGGNWYLVMDFVEGETLEKRLQDAPGGRLPLSEALNVTRQLCDVLEYLHSQHPPVIFRDLKPGNVMLTPQGEVKLIDFGIARFFKAGQTRDTINLGTPGYASPELFGGLGQSDPRSDVYSLGALLLQMVSGYDPVAAVTPFPLPAPGSLMPGLPPYVEETISRATQLQPTSRHQSVVELRQALFPPTSYHAEPPVHGQGKGIRVGPGFEVVLILGLLFATIIGGILLPRLVGSLVGPTESPLPTYQTLSPVPSSSPSPTSMIVPATLPSATLVQERISLDNVSRIVEQGHWRQEGVLVLAASSRAPLVAVGASTSIYLLDANSLTQSEQVLQSSVVHSLASSPDGKILAVGLSDGEIYLHTLGQTRKTLAFTGHTGSVNDLALSLDGSLLASASSDNTVRIWDTKAQEILEELEEGDNVLSVDVSPCGSWVAFGTEQGEVGTWSIRERQVTLLLNASSGPVYDVAFSPDSVFLATATADTTIKLWDPETGDLLVTLVGHTGPVYALSFNWRGDVLSSASADGTVRLWDVAAGAETRTLVGHENRVSYVAFGLNSQKLFTAGGDGTVRAWGVP